MSNSLKILPQQNMGFHLPLSPIAFGGASISGEGGGYGFGNISINDSLDILEYSLAHGINVFDTAPIYGFGQSETTLGQFIKNKREKVFVISKSGVDWHDTKRVNMTNHPENTQRMLHESLKRLNTDYIDLFMIHWPDKNTDIRKPLEVLNQAKRENKIRYIGLCNTNENDLKLAQEIDEIHMVQSEFNLFNQQMLKSDLFPLLQPKKIPFMGWGPLDKGILNLSVTKDRKYDKEDSRASAPWWKKDVVQTKVELMQEFRKVFSPNETLLAFLMKEYFSFPEYKMWLAGCKNKKQWEDIISAYNFPMSEKRSQEIKQVWNSLNQKYFPR